LSKLVKSRPNPAKVLPYESGILPGAPTRQRFSIDFYLTAMLFIVFDIELALLYPIAVTLRDDGLLGLVVLLVFVFTVVEALVYIWKKGALEWR
jgi:NADH-quinone oxidoreductase subunit A